VSALLKGQKYPFFKKWYFVTILFAVTNLTFFNEIGGQKNTGALHKSLMPVYTQVKMMRFGVCNPIL